MSFNGFEHKLLKNIRENFKDLSNEEIYIACSGGADSVALFISLNQINALIGAKIHLLHIHHGKCKEGEQSHYRDNAASFCKALATSYGCGFVLAKSEEDLVSEEDCRDFRLSVYEKYLNVFLGQHKDDFTETLLLRLIRGTGPQGLANPFSKNLHRPFLSAFSRAEILDYMGEVKAEYVEDPSNSNDEYLRNWLRNSWLPALEKKRGIKGLATSLQLISEGLKAEEEKAYEEVKFNIEADNVNERSEFKSGSFKYLYWADLNRYQKQSTIAHVLLKMSKKSYTKGQVDEIVKNLDLREKTTTFKSGGLCWLKNENEIVFSKP